MEALLKKFNDACSQYEVRPMDALIRDEPYAVLELIWVTTKFGPRVQALLMKVDLNNGQRIDGDMFRVYLPNRLSLSLTEEDVTMYNNLGTQFSLIYRGKMGRKKSLCNEKSEVLKWVSESCGTEIRSLQQLWDTGPNTLGKYIEQLNNQDVTWWAMQDLARSSFAVPQVMTRQDMGRGNLSMHAEKKFLRLLLRLKEALERSAGSNSLRVSGDLVAKGVALSAAYVGMRGVFFIYSYRNQLEGVQIKMTGPGDVKVETKLKTDGLMVGYTVDKSGMYILSISKNNWFVPGSPFQVNVQDPPLGNLWDKPETHDNQVTAVNEQQSQPNSLQWETEHDLTFQKPIPKAFPSRPKRKRKNPKVSTDGSKQQIVELSQIAAAIILARRFTNRMQSRIPELRVERPNDQQTELNLWSKAASPPSLREINYLSPEGATFPISVSNRRDDDKPEKWNEHSNQSLDDWLLGRTAEFNRGSEPYLCLPEQDVFPKSRPSAGTFQRGSPNIVRPVRPFNQSSAVTASSGSDTESMKRRADGRVWTHCASIGVNTDESWINTTSGTSELKTKFKSQGVQVGKSFASSETIDVNTFHYNHYEIKAALSQEEYRRIDHGSLLKEHSSQDSVLSRTKKCDTFNSDDTSSSVTTNYSEKIIEMDLKVQYETIALTSTDDSDSARRESMPEKRRSSSQDLHLPSVDDSSISRKNCGKRDFEEFSDRMLSAAPNQNPKELVKRQSIDGIYKATLMSIDSSPTKTYFLSSEGSTENPNLTDNSMKPASCHVNENKYNEGGFKSEYELSSYKDELLKLKLDYDSAENVQGDQNRSHYFCMTRTNRIELVRQFDLAQIELDDPPKISTRRIDQRRLKQLMKKRWTSKIPSRRVVKQGSGTCKRHLRKTLSLIPKLSDQDEAAGPKTSALYSFGPYPVKKDVVHIQTPVRAWTNFWDNIANRTETNIRRDCSIKNKGLVRKGKSALQKLSLGKTELPDVAQDEGRKRSIIRHIECNVVCIDERRESRGSYQKRILSGNWKSKFHHSPLISTVDMLVDRFENAKQLFTGLEKDDTQYRSRTSRIKSSCGKKSDYLQIQPHWDLKNLFQDFNQGLGKPGVANRLGVLASLHSVEPLLQIGGYESQYPHLPISSSSPVKSSVVQYLPRLS